jgi:hypothetical protein
MSIEEDDVDHRSCHTKEYSKGKHQSTPAHQYIGSGHCAAKDKETYQKQHNPACYPRVGDGGGPVVEELHEEGGRLVPAKEREVGAEYSHTAEYSCTDHEYSRSDDA